MADIQELDNLKIPLKDIKLATNNFSKDNFIAKGGFGRVYKGHLTGEHSTTEVAVKRLDTNITGQGQREFLMEIVMLASYKHINLVSLVGFSDEDKEKLLIYKYEVNGSLDNHLSNTNLTWIQRLVICLGAARGLEYLHDGVGLGHRVLHRDIKSSNILIDANWDAKISDFGLCKIGPTNQQFTFLVTTAAGTYGYMDPQYIDTGILTKESDVYSFGVVLFEVLCGRLATVEEYHDVRRFLFRLVKLRYDEGKLDEIIMAGLRTQMNEFSLKTFSKVAYQCLNKDRRQRPTMDSIVKELQISLEFQTGVRKVAESEIWGSSTGGAAWSFQLEGTQKLRKIIIDHQDWIFSLGFTTKEFNRLLISSREYGGNGGRSGGQLSEITFDDDEEIIEIFGTVGVTTGYYRGYTVISSLCFVTNKNRQFGPFGIETGTRFSMQWGAGSFGGFYGRAGYYLDGLGFYTKVIM